MSSGELVFLDGSCILTCSKNDSLINTESLRHLTSSFCSFGPKCYFSKSFSKSFSCLIIILFNSVILIDILIVFMSDKCCFQYLIWYLYSSFKIYHSSTLQQLQQPFFLNFHLLSFFFCWLWCWLVSALLTDRDVQIQNSEEALCLIKPDITQLCLVERAARLNQSPSRLWKCAVNGRNTDHPSTGWSTHLLTESLS